jgi:hypothetical protein
MAKRINHDSRTIDKYARLAKTAVDCGVSFEIIIAETRRYHGDKFADLVTKRMNVLGE